MNKKAFSIVELLIVLTIIGILMGSVLFVISNLGKKKSSATKINAETIAGYINDAKTGDYPKKFFYVFESAQSATGITVTPVGNEFGVYDRYSILFGTKTLRLGKQNPTMTISKNFTSPIFGYGGFAILPTYIDGIETNRLTSVCLTLKNELGVNMNKICNNGTQLNNNGWKLIFIDLKTLDFKGLTGYTVEYNVSGTDTGYIYMSGIILSDKALKLNEDTHCLARVSGGGYSKLHLGSCQFRFTPEIIDKTESDIPKNPITNKYPIVGVYFNYLGETTQYQIYDIVYKDDKQVDFIKGNYYPLKLKVKATKINNNQIKITNSLDSIYTIYEIDTFTDGVIIGSKKYTVNVGLWSDSFKRDGIIPLNESIYTTSISDIESIGNDGHMPNSLIVKPTGGSYQDKIIIPTSSFPSTVLDQAEN